MTTLDRQPLHPHPLADEATTDALARSAHQCPAEVVQRWLTVPPANDGATKGRVA